MKNTIVTVALFILLSFLFSEKTLALVPVRNDINLVVTLVPTSTPTPIIFKKIDPNINLKLIPTLESKLTVTPTPTLETKATVTPTPTASQLGGQATPSETEIIPSITVIQEKYNSKNKVDLKTLFMGITVGLLVLIIIIQLLPKKKKDQ